LAEAIVAKIDDPRSFFVEWAAAVLAIRLERIPSLREREFNRARIEAIPPQVVDASVLKFIDPLLASAHNGSATADRLLRLVASRIGNRGELLPGPLQKYVSNILHRQGPKLKHVRQDTLVRDGHIVEVIQGLIEGGNSANAATEIVQTALARMNYNITINAVNKVWKRKKKTVGTIIKQIVPRRS
jgi:hypothetical protein